MEVKKITLIFLTMFVPMWCVLVPFGTFLFICFLPFRLFPMGLVKKTIPQQNLQVTIIGGDDDDKKKRDKRTKGKEDIVFIHGWPDSKQLWSRIVPNFSSNHRCICVTLPNYAGKGPNEGWGVDFDEIADDLVRTIEKEKKSSQVTIICHDWGCFHAFNVYGRRPNLIKRIAALDVAPQPEKSISFLLFSVTYQFFLIYCWLLGSAGTCIQRIAMYNAKYRARPISELYSTMNYSYYYIWKAILFGSRKERRKKLNPPLKCYDLATCPIYFAYGRKKICMFHSKKWIDLLKKNSNCMVSSFDCDHWIPTKKAMEVSDEISAWMRSSE